MTRAASFPGPVDKWHPYGNLDPFVLPAAADRALDEFFLISKQVDVFSFLLYGTCLGLYRDGGYIEGDQDLDVGSIGDVPSLVRDPLKAGFRMIALVATNVHFLKYGIILDLWFSFPSVEYFQSPDKFMYKNKSYNFPSPLEDFLASEYGDWKTKSLSRALTRYPEET